MKLRPLNNRRQLIALGLMGGVANLLAFGQGAAQTSAQTQNPALSLMDIWPSDAPGGEAVTVTESVILRNPNGGNPNDTAFLNVKKPWLLMRRPEKPNGASVLIIPGGGYVRVAVSKQGGEIDAWLASLGYTVFTMTYRLPGDGVGAAGPEVALQDAQRAMRLIASMAPSLGLDAKNIGVMGFSAGGHVAGLLATRHAKSVYKPIDEIDRLSARPCVVALGYPVISMFAPFAHSQSARALLGKDPNDEQRRAQSLEFSVGPDTPPVVVFGTTNDPAVPSKNSLLIYEALIAAKIPSELHLYNGNTHGFSLKDKSGQLRPWGPEVLRFMRAFGLDPISLNAPVKGA